MMSIKILTARVQKPGEESSHLEEVLRRFFVFLFFSWALITETYLKNRKKFWKSGLSFPITEFQI